MKPGRLQQRIISWLGRTYGQQTLEKEERSLRYAEESMELLQAAGVDKDTLLKIVDHVYSRPKGDVDQEVTGSYITLVGMCHAHGIDLHNSVDNELDRVEQIKDACRTKHDSKPEFMRTHYADQNKPKLKPRTGIDLDTFGNELSSFINAIDYPDDYIARISDLYRYLGQVSNKTGLFYTTKVESTIDFTAPVSEPNKFSGDSVLRQPIQLHFTDTICTEVGIPNVPYKGKPVDSVHVEFYTYGSMRGVHNFELGESIEFRTPFGIVTIPVSILLGVGCYEIRVDVGDITAVDNTYIGYSKVTFVVS